MKLTSVAVIAFLLILISCKSDLPENIKPDAPTPGLIPSDLFITNEGSFQWGNASVSYFKHSDSSFTVDIFKAANNRPLGDICQSMEIFNGKAYIVVNNSNKIEIVDPKNFKSLGVINGLTSPRYFLGIDSSKAYVTDLFSNAISVIDINSNTKIKDIPCHGWTEELVLANGKVFVTNMRKSYVYVVNTSTDVLGDSIQVGKYPNSIKQDKNGKLWVLCGGDSSSTSGSLHRIDPVTEQIELSLSLSNPSESPWRLDINGTKDTLYYLNNGVYRFPIVNTSLPTNALVPQNSFLFYGIGIDPITGIIYVSDAVDYIQRGKIYCYKPNGTLIGSFDAGINPGDFYFY